MSYRTTIAALTLGTAVAFGSAVSAQSYFGNQMVADMDANVITLNVVTAESAGYVAIYDFTGGEVGDKLGEMAVLEGANASVRIGLNGNVTGNLMAVLFAGEMMADADPMTGVAMLEIDVQD